MMSFTDAISYFVAIFFPLTAIYLVLVSDIFDTGKTSIIAIFTVWGLLGAFLLAYTINDYLIAREGYRFVTLYGAPLIEEICKALLLLVFIRSPRFHYFIDGAVYGFATGIGFAIAENVYYLSQSSADLALNLALTRVLSATLMHATSSALFGIALGLTRRTTGWQRLAYPVFGFVLAVITHLIYNNVLYRSEGILLLLVGISIGVGGGLLILIFIDQGQVNEKRHLNHVLGNIEGKAVEQYGSDTLNTVLEEAALYFGREKANLIQRYLILQANMGILKNNLELPVSERLRLAWQGDITALEIEAKQLQDQLGIYAMTFFLRNLLPQNDPLLEKELAQRVMLYDPYRVHAFDLYILQSEEHRQINSSILEARATLLSQVSIFQHVPEVELQNLSRALVEKPFEVGETLFQQGDEGDAMYFIQAGEVEVQLRAGSQRFQVGDILGEMALLDGQPRSAKAAAITPVKSLVLKREHFLMFIQSRPHVILAMLQLMAGRVRKATRALEMGAVWAHHLSEGDFEKAQQTAFQANLDAFAKIAFRLEERHQHRQAENGHSPTSTDSPLS